MASVREQQGEIRGFADEPWPVWWRVAAAGGADDAAPILYVHGVPTSSDDWLPLLERVGGVAPDLPGFGRSSKRGDGDFTLDGYARFTGAFVDALGLDRVRLVVHDWGGAALAWAAAHPERIERLAVVDAVPLLPGYRWHRVARLWRTPVVGEVAMGLTSGPVLRRALPGDLGARAAPLFDQGTQRAILRLYRSAPPERLAAAGAGLAALRDVPTLVLWGERDPYLPARFAHDYAAALGAGDPLVVAGAGHWPWVDDRRALDALAEFLG